MRQVVKAKKLYFRWWWWVWSLGYQPPHGGMIVHTFYLGPLIIEWWPRAYDEVAF